MTDEQLAEITEIATVRAPKNGLTPEQIIREASYYAERANTNAARAVQWAIDSLLFTGRVHR